MPFSNVETRVMLEIDYKTHTNSVAAFQTYFQRFFGYINPIERNSN